jgi:hypothetical protein
MLRLAMGQREEKDVDRFEGIRIRELERRAAPKIRMHLVEVFSAVSARRSRSQRDLRMAEQQPH